LKHVTRKVTFMEDKMGMWKNWEGTRKSIWNYYISNKNWEKQRKL